MGQTLTNEYLRTVISTLEQCDGVKTRAAEMLGVSESTFRGQLNKALSVKDEFDVPDICLGGATK